MPTAAQRQRAAALAQLNNQHKGQPTHRSQLGQPSITKEHSKNTSNISPAPPASSSSSKKKIEVEWDDGAFSDEDSEDEEAAAFEMDGQDIWTQNYCSICDTLIEPGQGLNAKRDEIVQQTAQNPSQQSLHSPTSSISRNSSNGLKSKSGTIKARPPSSDGTGSNFKRTHSAGRIHAVGGGATGFGPSKRTGSAGSRLNALSELKPTTKLNPDNGKNTRPADGNASATKSPAMSRRSSNVSVRSGNSGGAGANSSGPPSPMSPTSNLPRTKKGGILGTLTPAALKQQEDLEIAKSKAPPALYCSERCRLIDEQRSSGMGELVYYLHQPTSPTAPWQTSVSGSYGAWSSRASNPNISALALNPAEYRITPPGSECNCPECMEKNSTGGTVPSGASDTTESSNSYQYGPRGYKQRTTSGRIVTPQNLYPPGGHKNDYFGNVQSAQVAKRRSHSNSIRDDLNHLHTHRDSMSQTGTESSARSSDSGSDLWEPRVRSGKMTNTMQGRERASSTAASIIASDAGRGSTTTGTVTPEGTLNRSMEYLNLTSGSSNGTAARSQSGHNGLSDSLSTSQASTTSPLRLLRRGDHRGMASVDVTSDVATSPQPYAANTVLSRSIASERTEDGASSGFTVAAPSLNMERRQSSRASMVDATITGETYPAAELSRVHLQRYTDSPAPLDSSNSASRAVGTLKNAQARAAAQRTLSTHSREMDGNRRASTNGDSSNQGDSGSSSSSWFRSSISAAWNSLRGGSSSDSNNRRDSMYEPYLYKSEERGMTTPSAENSEGFRTEEPTPTQSLIKRPTIKRGDVPAFANEIGRGDIPGERSIEEKKDGSDVLNDNESVVSLSKSVTSAHGSIESERLRKKAERERIHRHQRSRDIAVLPPLLGVARPSSNANLHGGMRGNRTYSSTSVRSDAAVPDSPLLPPVRSNTPGLRRGSSHSASLVGLQEYGTSPGRMAAASFGTSPRRAGLGWGALTPLGPPAQNMLAERNTGSNQTSNMGRPTHHAHHHHHHHHHNHHHHHHHNGHPHHHNARQSLQPPHHRSQGAIPLGTIGMLGMHPHGNAQIKGRHSTTPVRMSTPRVPEHGGEMSGAQLKGEEMTDDDLGGREFMQSRSLNRRSYLVAPPTRPKSGMSMRGQGSTVMMVDQHGFPLIAPLRPPSRAQTPGNASEDGQNAAPVKLYPVLDVPNRQPTHDRYDNGWALDEQGLIPLLSNKEAEQKPTQQNNIAISNRENSKRIQERPTTSTEDPNDPSRKKLFYFDTS